MGFVARAAERESPGIADEPPPRRIAGEPAEGFLEDVLRILGRSEHGGQISIQRVSIEIVHFLEIHPLTYDPVHLVRPPLAGVLSIGGHNTLSPISRWGT